MIRIDVSRAMRGLTRDLNLLERQQVPFAAAQTLNQLAREVTEAEGVALDRTFDRPTPFTERAFGFSPARKYSLSATVGIKPIQSAYLTPYIEGGPQVLGSKRGLLKPKNIRLNQYGNLTKNKLASLKAKPNIFIGAVRFKSGAVINGVWERPDRGKQRSYRGRRTGGVGTKGSTLQQGLKDRTGLKLLIRFGDPVEVKERLPYYETAERVIRAGLAPAFRTNLAKAMASRRR